ncbi:MAG TPA: DUF1684 domain-containing protein [Candidatus Bathyarchaeia archaeon]|jgi:uncharacterized protein (DUF1684 family)|nr:DUF1684 domain-containing protein [Candidatus Bathyarchaeia archaeon]
MVKRAAGLVVLALTCACSAPPSGFTIVPPPNSWAEDLRIRRTSKDASFANDPDSPLPVGKRAGFRGLTYFKPDPSWRYAGYIERYPSPERFTIVTTSGKERPCERYGRIAFERDGSALTLQVYRLLDLPERDGGLGLFLPFKDGTTGKETYAAGRYVDLEGEGDGPYLLDFNRAYAPSCAYGDPHRFQCPVTPKENTLPLRVEAGERTG